MRTARSRVGAALTSCLLLILGAGEGWALQASVEPGSGVGAAGTPGDSLELVFEREVFAYPTFPRRNPFRPLTGTDVSGPRFEDLVLMGRILSSTPSASIALIGVRQAGSAATQPPVQTYRMRVGDGIGNVRIVGIREQSVLVEVEEFGLRETRALELGRVGPVPLDPTPVPPAAETAPDPEPGPPADPDPDDALPDAIGMNFPRSGNGDWT